jgi:excinuclease UvrABC nuclease subunit
VRQFSPEFFKTIPNEPGVYFFLGGNGEILYIGKAKRLRKRVGSYRHVKPRTHPPHQVEMVKRIRKIRWEVCKSEAHALSREYELLHAVRPPYNIADTEEATYLFVTLRKIRKPGYYEFQLTSEPDGDQDVAVFGCYKDRLNTKRGFSALLRLIYSASCQGARFSIPSVLRRARVEFGYTLAIEEQWLPMVSSFMRGESLQLLRTLSERLIENESVPRFMGPSLQDDIDSARAFFQMGPKSTRLLKRQYRFRSRVLSHEQMDALIRKSLLISATQDLAQSPLQSKTPSARPERE